MITKQDLIDRHNKRLEYAKQPKSGYGSPPKSLFYSNKTFAEDNWNGGEAIIRQYTAHLDSKVDNNRLSSEFELQTGADSGIGGDFLAVYSWFNDSNYVQTRNYEWYEDKSTEWKFDQYLIAYYKDRGKTDIITKNGKPITFDEYVELLNIIETTGFKFKLTD